MAANSLDKRERLKGICWREPDSNRRRFSGSSEVVSTAIFPVYPACRDPLLGPRQFGFFKRARIRPQKTLAVRKPPRTSADDGTTLFSQFSRGLLTFSQVSRTS